MTTKARITFQFTLAGLCWTVIGILRFLPKSNTLLEIVQWSILAVACIVTVISALSKKDLVDEMAQNHFSEASTWGFIATTACILVSFLFSSGPLNLKIA